MKPPTPSTKDALERTARDLLRSGRSREALTAYEALLTAYPGLADGWYNLAYLQEAAGHHATALASYGKALELGVDRPEEVHLNRAVILADHLNRADEAEQAFSTALALDPLYVPALVNLGNLHEQRGDREQALQAYARALAIDPANALALSRLPGLQLPEDNADPLIARIRVALCRPGITAAERADLGFGLGRALDAVGDYDAAFAAYAAANGDSRRAAKPRPAEYDARAQERLVDDLIRAFPRATSEECARAPAPNPLFICGMFRSGSTLVEQILASHSRVTAGGEMALLPALARENLLPRLGSSPPAIDPGRLPALREAYREGLACLHPGANVVTDKRPDNFLYIGFVKELFPDAQIVHTVRDPIDNCLSVYFLHLDHTMAYALDLEDTAHWYLQYQRLMRHWKSIYGDSIHDVDYDELVRTPRPRIERLLEACGLPWEDACLAFHRTRTLVKTPSAWQVRRPMYLRSSGRWRHYEQHLGPLLEALEQFRRA